MSLFVFMTLVAAKVSACAASGPRLLLLLALGVTQETTAVGEDRRTDAFSSSAAYS